jgi:hypothetical protein
MTIKVDLLLVKSILKREYYELLRSSFIDY